jgi:uncharacterized protein (DUF1778 family)
MTKTASKSSSVRARRAIAEHHHLELTVRDSEAFVTALLNPSPVNARLRDTARRYREAIGAFLTRANP